MIYAAYIKNKKQNILKSYWLFKSRLSMFMVLFFKYFRNRIRFFPRLQSRNTFFFLHSWHLAVWRLVRVECSVEIAIYIGRFREIEYVYVRQQFLNNTSCMVLIRIVNSVVFFIFFEVFANDCTNFLHFNHVEQLWMMIFFCKFQNCNILV